MCGGVSFDQFSDIFGYLHRHDVAPSFEHHQFGAQRLRHRLSGVTGHVMSCSPVTTSAGAVTALAVAVVSAVSAAVVTAMTVCTSRPGCSPASSARSINAWSVPGAKLACGNEPGEEVADAHLTHHADRAVEVEALDRQRSAERGDRRRPVPAP